MSSQFIAQVLKRCLVHSEIGLPSLVIPQQYSVSTEICALGHYPARSPLQCAEKNCLVRRTHNISCTCSSAWRAAIRLLLASYNALILLERLFHRSLSQTSPKYTNIHIVVTDTVINHESEITHVNITQVRARESVSYLDSKPLFCALVKRGEELRSMFTHSCLTIDVVLV